MNITVNGKVREVPSDITVEQLLVQYDLGNQRVAVEHNDLIVERTEFSKQTVREGDRLEIVRFVGGG